MVKRLYGKRSGVSHGGRKAILETDLTQLEAITQAMTVVMIRRKDEFSSQEDLLDWIEEQKLGS